MSARGGGLGRLQTQPVSALSGGFSEDAWLFGYARSLAQHASATVDALAMRLAGSSRRPAVSENVVLSGLQHKS